jgi:hypothetical protein
MTWEEAIKILRKRQRFCKVIAEYANETVKADELREVEALDMAISALRPVSQEWVEKVWTGCEKCRDQANWPSWIEKGFVYCPKCGTPLTSWAWEKQVERLEALHEITE